MLPITTLAGDTHLLTNIKQVNRKRKVNGDKTLSFLTMPNAINKHAWESVVNEAVTDFLGEPYVFKTITEKSVGQSSDKQIDGIHRFFTSMIDCYQEKTFSGSLTYAAALTMVFEKTLYGFTVVDALSAQTVENFGADNCLALFQKLLETYGAEFKIVGKQVYLYQKIGADTGFQFRWKHNVKAISKTINSNNLSTYIRGYGKLKDKQDVLSGTKIPYESKTGTYFSSEGSDFLGTSKVGATFKFSFTGTGFNFDTAVHFIGGVWEFTIDGSQTIKISLYKDVDLENKTFEVVRGLEHKKHNVTGKFVGADSKNPYTKGPVKDRLEPQVYLKNSNCFGIYRELVGDERFTTVAEYKSPNATLFPNPDSPDQLRHAGVITDDKITNYDTLLAKLKANLQDEPELSITVDIAELGDNIGELNEGDRGYIIYEPMNIKVNARIVEIDETFEFIDKKWTLVKTAVTLSNSSKKLTDITTRFSQTSKTVDRLLSGLEKVPFRALDDAVATATKALLSAQTELEFTNGIIARDKTDANKLVLFNSAGLGITNDGGQNFKTAITGDGIIAESIMAGIIRGAIIASDSEESYMWVQGGDVRLEDPTRKRSMNLNPLGLYGFNDAGEVIFQVNNSWVTSGILGTNTKNVYLAAGLSNEDISGEARIVHIRGIPGDGEIASYYYLPVRAQGIYANFIEANGGTDGIHVYGRPRNGGEFRVTGANTTDVYYPLRAGNIYGSGFTTTSTSLWMGTDSAMHVVNKGHVEGTTAAPIYRDVYANDYFARAFITRSTHAYVGADGELRVVNKGLGDIYRDVRALGYFGQYLVADPDMFAYIGSDLGLRVTSRGLADAGPIYRNVTAAGFTNGSRIESKTNIEMWKEDSFPIIKGSDIATYNLKGDLEQELDIKKFGFVIGGDWRTPQQVINGDGVDQYAMTSILWKGMQQAITKIEELENKILKLESA